jgi:hypothetical protein
MIDAHCVLWSTSRTGISQDPGGRTDKVLLDDGTGVVDWGSWITDPDC